MNLSVRVDALEYLRLPTDKVTESSGNENKDI